MVNWILRGHRTQEVEMQKFKASLVWTLIFRFYHLAVPSVHPLTWAFLFPSPYFSLIHNGFSFRMWLSYLTYLGLHDSSCCLWASLSLSSTLLWSSGHKLWWSVYIIHHIFILEYPRLSIAKHYSVPIICLGGPRKINVNILIVI